ncbi:MAG: carboxypeptidase regulatory-like domain-containing protein [Myxococcota bacterium]
MRRGLAAVLVAVSLVSALLVWWLRRPVPVTTTSPPAPRDAGVPRWRASAFLGTPGAPVPTAELTRAPAERRGGCLEGRVVSVVTGRGVARASVRFLAGGEPLVVTADDEGRFDVNSDAPELELLEARADGFFPLLSEGAGKLLTARPGAGACATGLVVPLVPQLQYRGVVLDEAEKPVAGAAIEIQDGESRTTASAADGSFSFHARDGALIVARKEGFEPAVVDFGFSAQISGEVVLVLRTTAADGGVREAVLEGRVEDLAGAARAGVEVKLSRRTELGWLEAASARSDAEGRFQARVEGPPPWRVSAVVVGAWAAPVETRGEPVVLRLSTPATLAGRVSDRRGQPVPAFVITVRQKLGPLEQAELVSHRVVDAEGRYELNGLPAGTVVASASALGFAPAEPLELRLDASRVSTADFTLREGGTVEGRVVDRKTKAPLAGAVVSLEGQGDTSLLMTTSARTDEHGRFVLPGLKPGRRSLFVAASGHHARIKQIEARADEVTGPIELELTPVAEGERPRVELVGIGAVLEAKGDALVIKRVLPGGGAAEADLVEGDGILSIEGQLSVNVGFVGGIELIRGEEGTTVLLSVRRHDGALVDVRVPRRVIQ